MVPVLGGKWSERQVTILLSALVSLAPLIVGGYVAAGYMPVTPLNWVMVALPVTALGFMIVVACVTKKETLLKITPHTFKLTIPAKSPSFDSRLEIATANLGLTPVVGQWIATNRSQNKQSIQSQDR